MQSVPISIYIFPAGALISDINVGNICVVPMATGHMEIITKAYTLYLGTIHANQFELGMSGLIHQLTCYRRTGC